MYCIVKGIAEVYVYEMRECECCGQMIEHDEVEERDITVLVNLPAMTTENASEYLEAHVENTADPGTQILLRNWISEPTIEDLYPDLINRIVGAPELITVTPAKGIRPAYERLAKKMSMDNFINDMNALEVN